jgi:hypothetical protein
LAECVVLDGHIERLDCLPLGRMHRKNRY